MSRNLIYKENNYICKDICNHDIVFLISGPVLYRLIVNDISLKHMEAVAGNGVSLQILSHCRNGIFIQICSPDLLCSQL